MEIVKDRNHPNQRLFSLGRASSCPGLHPGQLLYRDPYTPWTLHTFCLSVLFCSVYRHYLYLFRFCTSQVYTSICELVLRFGLFLFPPIHSTESWLLRGAGSVTLIQTKCSTERLPPCGHQIF